MPVYLAFSVGLPSSSTRQHRTVTPAAISVGQSTAMTALDRSQSVLCGVGKIRCCSLMGFPPRPPCQLFRPFQLPLTQRVHGEQADRYRADARQRFGSANSVIPVCALADMHDAMIDRTASFPNRSSRRLRLVDRRSIGTLAIERTGDNTICARRRDGNEIVAAGPSSAFRGDCAGLHPTHAFQ